jgi:hypothetical protein
MVHSQSITREHCRHFDPIEQRVDIRKGAGRILEAIALCCGTVIER